MKKIIALILGLIMIATLVACNGSSKTGSQTDKGESGNADGKLDPNISATLSFAAWDTNAIGLYDSLDLEGRFQKLYPNVKIEIEEFANDSEYWDAMKIRSTADQLPDIMYNKPFTLSRFQNYMYDLTKDMPDIIANNLLADGYALNGMVLGIPEKSVGDYVFYWSDMFEAASVSVPQTWGEFIDACYKL